MSVRDTSLIAYIEISESGKRVTKREALFRFLRLNDREEGWSRSELSKATGLTINNVCGRINELLEGGQVYETTRRACQITRRTINPLRPA